MKLDYIRHYYLHDKKPFLNLSDLQEDEMDYIVKKLNHRKESGDMHRGYPDWYFPQRKEAEFNLREAFINKGGNPERKSPHYFSLGRSLGYEWIYKHNFKSIDIQIESISSEIYFSIGDTLWTFAKSYNPEVEFENKWYQGKLYNYKETIQIIEELGVDLLCTESINQHKIFCIEAFIWSDRELNDLLKSIKYNKK
jgi:hypothetical protein